MTSAATSVGTGLALAEEKRLTVETRLCETAAVVAAIAVETIVAA